MNNEYLSEFFHIPKAGILMKTHFRRDFVIKTGLDGFDFRLWQLMMHNKAVLLLRNPYKALISYWKHLKSKDVFNAKEFDLKSDLLLNDKHFYKFVWTELRRWRDLALDFIEFSPNLYILHYENLVEKQEEEIVKVLRFLKVPINDEKLECIRNHPHTNFKRRQKIDNDNIRQYFNDDLWLKIDNTIEEVNEAIMNRFNDAKNIIS